MNPNIAFIGCGNMTKSLIGGLIADNCPSENIHITDLDIEGLNTFAQNTQTHACESNADAVAQADVVVLAVKPQGLKAVCEEIKASVQARKPLIVSIAAGIRMQDIENWLGGDIAIVRTMPNTPSLLSCGASGLVANAKTNDTQKSQAESIMRSTGVAVWVEDEAQIDTVTAVSGSGPAYYFLFMEAMEATAQKMGLDAKTAHLLTTQTALGAARMAIESQDNCATLRQKVTSPGGTTEQAINTFIEGELPELVEKAMQAAQARAKTLADELGD